MPRTLPKDDSDGRDFLQFRGAQTSVTHDPTGVQFGTTEVQGRRVHAAVPVVDPDDPDPPEGAVARAVADELTERNPLVCWGVACHRCGDVFDSPSGRNSHLSVHADDDGD